MRKPPRTESGIVTDEEIKAAFANTNFGTDEHRKLLEQGVLKRVAGYISGYTLTMILRELGLTDKADRLTRKGKMFCFNAFYKQKHSG
jgi:hypothetical protein